MLLLSEKNGGASKRVLRPTVILCRGERGSRLRTPLSVHVDESAGEKI